MVRREGYNCRLQEHYGEKAERLWYRGTCNATIKQPNHCFVPTFFPAVPVLFLCLAISLLMSLSLSHWESDCDVTTSSGMPLWVEEGVKDSLICCCCFLTWRCACFFRLLCHGSSLSAYVVSKLQVWQLCALSAVHVHGITMTIHMSKKNQKLTRILAPPLLSLCSISCCFWSEKKRKFGLGWNSQVWFSLYV